MKWSRFGLITVGNTKTLFLCYAAVTHILAKSFQESTRCRVEILLAIVVDSGVLYLYFYDFNPLQLFYIKANEVKLWAGFFKTAQLAGK